MTGGPQPDLRRADHVRGVAARPRADRDGLHAQAHHRERTLDNAMDKVMLSLTNFASERVQPPRNHRTGWAPTAILEILRRPLYRGEIVWGKGQKAMRGSAKALRRRRESEWLRVDAPDLRIVPADLGRAQGSSARMIEAAVERGVGPAPRATRAEPRPPARAGARAIAGREADRPPGGRRQAGPRHRRTARHAGGRVGPEEGAGPRPGRARRRYFAPMPGSSGDPACFT